jgi:DNA-nicking Smr family endonuclease
MPKKRPQAPRPKRTETSSDAVEYKPFAGLKAMRESLAPEKGKGKPGSPAPTPGKAARATPAVPARDPEDDRLSMHRLMSGVKPLDARPQRLPRSQGIEAADRVATSRAAVAERVEAEAKAEADAVHAHLRELVDGTARRFEVTDDGRRVEGRRTEMRADALRKLRHGLFPIDARIDLHGMTSEKARDALDRFLADQRARGERCVLVIHGKGEHSPRGMGVLRGEISAWLSQGSGSAHVAAFATAGADDGGEGAVYVLLTR